MNMFFSDGVPLNQNILAIKTQYQTIKDETDSQVHQIQNNIKEIQDLIMDLNDQISG